MKTFVVFNILLVLVAWSRSQEIGPATGPSGTVCESPGGSCVDLADGTKIPYSGNCSRYVVCFLECGCDMDCPSGLHFNKVLQVCDYPSNAGCDSSLSPGNPTTYTPGSVAPGSETPVTSTPNTDESASCDSTGASCTGVEFGTRLPYEGNCSRYVTCLDGCGVDMYCPPGLHFNANLTLCDWPENAGCGSSGDPVCPPAGASCAGVGSGALLPYSGNCSRYVQCLGDCGVDMDCPPGLHFNANLKVCDWPENAGCDGSGSNPGSTPILVSGSTPSPGSGPTPSPGSGPTPGPGSGPTPNPGSGPTPNPGSGPTRNPGSGPTPNPGSGPTRNPGSGPTPNPGSGPTPNPGSGQTPSPGSGPTPNPGSGPTPNPGSGPTPSPGSGPTPNPGSGPTPSPGSGCPTPAPPCESGR